MVLAALVLLGAVCAAGLIGFVYYKETHLPPVGEFDTIIVLGAQVKADGTPSVALERRLTAALEEYQKQPMLMIVCGAQGSDEPRAEGDVMRDWLIAHGVAAADIEAETDSFNTRQNLGYAQSIMDDRRLTAALIVTSDYHVPRALALCKQVGIIACGKGSPSKPEYFIKNHLREELPEGREHEEDADDAHFTTHSNRFVLGFLMLAFCVGLGSYVTTGLTKLCGFNFPAYIGPMLVAVAVRNLIDHTGHIEFPAAEISTMGNMFLAIFLSMALSGLKLWQLVDLALPMLVCLAAEVLLMVFFSILVLFPLMGRNYDAAMITAGFIGFGMGATSNAMANMQAVARRYGPSPSAYFMIPMVGGLFNDFFNAAIIALSIGLLS